MGAEAVHSKCQFESRNGEARYHSTLTISLTANVRVWAVGSPPATRKVTSEKISFLHMIGLGRYVAYRNCQLAPLVRKHIVHFRHAPCVTCLNIGVISTMTYTELTAREFRRSSSGSNCFSLQQLLSPVRPRDDPYLSASLYSYASFVCCEVEVLLRGEGKVHISSARGGYY